MQTLSLYLPNYFSTHAELLHGSQQEVILIAVCVVWHLL